MRKTIAFPWVFALRTLAMDALAGGMEQRRSRASGLAAHDGLIWLETVAALPYKVGSVHRVLAIVMPQPPPRRRRPPPKPSGPPLWVMGLFIAGLIGTMVWVIDRFVAYDKLQQCVTAGHRDCGPPVDVPKPDATP